jgi:hypothetical protein|tara:strand:+ start:667 stop:1020 length:354 start_codon:yes stop_codon:yes gene_type:complete
MNWNDFIKIVKKKYPKARPEKVLNMLKTSFDKKKTESNYDILRSSWSLLVRDSCRLKIGTPKDNKKRGPINIIRNWVKSNDYKQKYKLLHPGKLFKEISEEKHIKNCYDITRHKRRK